MSWHEMEEAEIAEAVNRRDERIRKMRRNQELMMSYLYGLVNEPREKTRHRLRAYMSAQGGFPDEME